jgi:hypothetical protein
VLEGWHARGAHSDLAEAGAALAGEISTFFRFVNTPLAGKYGGGESGICRFLRDVDRRIAAGGGKAELDGDERDFIDRALAGAWQAARQKYGEDSERWEARAREAVAAQKLGYFDSLEGLGSLDPAGDVAMPALGCVDGGTIQSQAAQSYTQFVPLEDVDAAQSLLPPGHAERAEDAVRASTVDLWRGRGLHPAPLSRQAVEGIAARKMVLSRN